MPPPPLLPPAPANPLATRTLLSSPGEELAREEAWPARAQVACRELAHSQDETSEGPSAQGQPVPDRPRVLAAGHRPPRGPLWLPGLGPLSCPFLHHSVLLLQPTGPFGPSQGAVEQSR